MRRIIKNSLLYDLEPDLVKEWHPSANGALTPRKVTIGHAKKVWWICRDSHEWQATIKSRMNGNGCPICGKKVSNSRPRKDIHFSDTRIKDKRTTTTSKSSAAIFEPEPVDFSLGHDFRNSIRYQMKATAVLESPATGHFFYADVKNFSAGGMGFEVDACINPGTKILIKLDRPLFESDQMNYDSEIKWCKVLDGEDQISSTHGLGAQFI